jgi:hypothetical protein
MPLGIQDSYDPLISFRSHAELTSDIRPIYIFCGALVEVLIAFHGEWEADNHGVWSDGRGWIFGEQGRRFGNGRLRDAVEFAVEIVLRDDAVERGGGRVEVQINGAGRGIEGECSRSKEAGVKEKVLGVYRVVLSAPYS